MKSFLSKGIDFIFALCYHTTNGLERTRTQRLFVYGIFYVQAGHDEKAFGAATLSDFDGSSERLSCGGGTTD